MRHRSIRNAFPAVILLVLCFSPTMTMGEEEEISGQAAADSESSDPQAESPDFPSELLLDPEKMPEPVRKNVLQRIDEHERLEELLRNQPLEMQQQKGTGD